MNFQHRVGMREIASATSFTPCLKGGWTLPCVTCEGKKYI